VVTEIVADRGSLENTMRKARLRRDRGANGVFSLATIQSCVIHLIRRPVPVRLELGRSAVAPLAVQGAWTTSRVCCLRHPYRVIPRGLYTPSAAAPMSRSTAAAECSTGERSRCARIWAPLAVRTA
jgi:hypothetical protein